MIYSRRDMHNVIEDHVVNPRYREVLRLRYCEGMTHEQVACTTNYSTQHVKTICKKYKDHLFSLL